MSYGWLKDYKTGFGWLGGNAGGASPWTVDTNTAALWYFDESSGAIVDEVASLSVTATGTPTYSVGVTGSFSNLHPGITTGSSNAFTNGDDSAEASLDINQEDFVIEAVLKTTSNTANQFLFDFWALSAGHGYFIGWNGTTEELNVYLEANDGTSVVNAVITGIDQFKDNDYHKIRVVGDRAGNMETFIDSISVDVTSMSTVVGKDIKCSELKIGNSSANWWIGTIAALKITIGDSTTNSGNEVTQYSYGYPSSYRFEPDVAAQWLFDEASGNIVDEVGSVTLTPNGSPTYSVSDSSPWSNMSPGITYGGVTFHTKAADPTLDIGLNDFVMEWVLNTTNTSSQNYLVSFYDTSNWGWEVVASLSSDIISLFFRGSDATFILPTYDISGLNLNNGENHKVRVTGDRSGNLELFIDGSNIGPVGSGSMAALVTKDIQCGTIRLPARSTGSNGWIGTVFEHRLTIGNATNDSGGPGE